MSIQKIHLRKLLLLFDASPKERTQLLRADITAGIRSEDRRAAGLTNDGGDFYGPFWADAKSHVAGELDLHEATKERIESNYRRNRLYRVLADTFLGWWDIKRRWRNSPFKFIPQNVKAQFSVSELHGVIKIEGLLALEVVDQFDRIIYPYFCETPTLSAESTRLGLWVLGKALTRYAQEDLRVLDVFRSASFGIGDQPFTGNEQVTLRKNYSAILDEWNKLKDEYKK